MPYAKEYEPPKLPSSRMPSGPQMAARCGAKALFHTPPEDVAAAACHGRAVHVARAEIDDAAAVLQVPVEDAVSAGAADVRAADDDTGVVDAAGGRAVRAAQRTH